VLGQFGIVMKGFDETLESYLEQVVLTTNQQIAISEVKNILHQIADALQFLYKKDLLHCEIKPENIFIRKHNNKVQVALIDIGVARLVPRIHKDPWMAPEATTNDKPVYGHSADVYGFGLIAIYLRTWPTLPYEFSNSVKSLQTSVGDESLFMLITDCLQYNPKNRIRKKDLVKHLFFKSTQVTKKEEVDKFKDILDEKANLKNQLAAMKRECNDLKSQSQEMDRLSIIESRVKKLKRRTLSLLEEEEEPVEEDEQQQHNQAAQEVVVVAPAVVIQGENNNENNSSSRSSQNIDSSTASAGGAKPKVLLETEDQNEEEIIPESSSRPLSRRGTKKFQMRDSSRSRDNSKTRMDSKDTAQATIECLDKNSKNNKMIIEKDEVVQLPKKQSSADIDTTIIAEASSENIKVHQNGQHIPPPPPPNESNSVKLNNEIPKESKNGTADEGISYNVTGKLKTLGDMIINETKPIPESVVEDTNEDEADNELDDFNEEEDYIKFLQKENMSPMIPKAKSNKLPLPVVTCEWTDKKSANSLPTYRPGLGYSSFIGRSKTTSNKFKTDEELNLTLKFENVSTKLPPKLQLEICDSDSGKVVFQKRQNIYYIKLQEKLASLDCDKN
jgi:serine/threonine protein kinase